MVSIIAKDLTVSYPILNSAHRSLKKAIISAGTGGRIASDTRNHMVVTALDGITFEVKPGERVALTGHNGSGKTTLLRTLAGVYAPTRGSLEVNGSISSLLDIMVGLDHEATGVENIVLRGILMGVSRTEIENRFDEIAAFADLGEYLYMPVRTYSSGMQLRLAFAVSTSFPRDILLMDEWLSVGDAAFSIKAENRLNDLIEQASILVVATHTSDLVQRLCTRQITMSHGSFVADEPVS
jgi:lipopolysaccharide transport system ATP-binding protein